MITVGAMRLPQPESLDDLDAFLRGLEPDGGYWLAMRRLADHDHSGGVMGVPVAGGGGSGGDVPPEYITESELATALGPYATDADLAAHAAAANPHAVYATDADLAAHAAAADPHAVYTTATEVATAITAHEGLANPHPTYATDADLTAHAGAVDPHPTYTTAAELSAALSAHAGLADPHPGYATDADLATHAAAADPHPGYTTAAEVTTALAPYLPSATAATTYLPLTGGALSGALSVTANLTAPGALGITANAGAMSLTATGNMEVNPAGNIFYPSRDNAVLLGWSSGRWAAVYAVAGAINTSSVAYKDPAGDLDPEAALAAVRRTPARRFRYKGTARVQSGYYLEEADPLFAIGPDEASASNDCGVLLGAVQALAARVAALEVPQGVAP